MKSDYQTWATLFSLKFASTKFRDFCDLKKRNLILAEYRTLED